jgi:hypothetical protein
LTPCSVNSPLWGENPSKEGVREGSGELRGQPPLMNLRESVRGQIAPIALHGRPRYHPVHATHMDTDRPTCRTLPYRSQYRPAYTGYDGDRPIRMDALSPRISYRACGPCVDGMGLDRHGLRHLWNGGIGPRPCHNHEHPGWTRRTRRVALLQRNERGREFIATPVRRTGVFLFVSGDRASSIPPSQSSVPFFIRKTLIRSNPASVNQALVSAAE